MADILTRILERKQIEVADRRVYQPLADLKARTIDLAPTRGFAQALRTKLARNQPAVTGAALTQTAVPSHTSPE